MLHRVPAPARATRILPGQRRALAVAGILALEVFTGWFSVALAPEGARISAYWPNAGLTVVALCLAERRWRPWVVAAVLPVSMAANLLGGREWDTALGLGLVNIAEPVAVMLLLTSGGRDRPRLMNLEDFARLTAAAIAGAAVAAVIAGLTIAGVGDDVFLITGAVFASHASALLIIPPLGMQLPQHHGPGAGRIETVLQWSMTMVTALTVFGPRQDLPLAFLPFPLLVWGAVRLRSRQMAVQLIIYAGLIATLTTLGYGPFAVAVRNADLAAELIGLLLTSHLVAAALVVTPLSLVRTLQQVTVDRLSNSLDMVSNILDATTATAILGTDLDGRIEFFNVGAEQLSGYTAEEVVGRASLAVVPAPHGHVRLTVGLGEEPDQIALETLIEPFLQSTRASFTADWDFVRRSGEVRTISVTTSRRYGDRGEAIGYLGVADDVTERRRHEAMVEAALEQEKQIVERLAQIDQTKNDFLSTVSHELRTPITSILGYSQLLMTEDGERLPPRQHQVVGRIERNGRRLMGLIEDMLTMSQVEVGTFKFHRQPIDLRDPLQRAIGGQQGSFAANELCLDVQLGEAALLVHGDADKLERVFANLLSNAAKFSHPRSTVTVRAELVCGNPGEGVVSVSDCGIGIGPEDRPHLFERFFRGADAHALAIQGVGLGLPIAASIVAGHDGRIDVVSELGSGSTFVVRLPLQGQEGPSS